MYYLQIEGFHGCSLHWVLPYVVHTEPIMQRILLGLEEIRIPIRKVIESIAMIAIFSFVWQSIVIIAGKSFGFGIYNKLHYLGSNAVEE